MPYAYTDGGTGTVWSVWSDTTNAVTADSVWGYWVDCGTSSGTCGASANLPSVRPAPMTEEERERAEQLRVEREQKRKQKEKDIQAAKTQAEKLLKSLLTPAQRTHLDDVSSFLVKSESERMFRVRRGSTVEELDEEDKVIARYCIHASWRDALPVADTMLTQKLMLEMNEAEFMKIANRSAA